jgi:hypothetical protein
MTVSAQMRQYPPLNFAMAKSACAGAVAVRPSASAPIAKRIFFIESRPQESEQDDKWSFCLTAGTLCPANQERQ